MARTPHAQWNANWVAKRKAAGGCVSCAQPALPGFSRCQKHRDAHRLSDRKGQPKREPITREMVIENLKQVAARLGARRISKNLYEREGNFSISYYLTRRLGPWPQVCVDAGLLPTYKGCKGIDIRPCTRCQKDTIWYSKEQRYCYECRRTVNRRKCAL